MPQVCPARLNSQGLWLIDLSQGSRRSFPESTSPCSWRFRNSIFSKGICREGLHIQEPEPIWKSPTATRPASNLLQITKVTQIIEISKMQFQVVLLALTTLLASAVAEGVNAGCAPADLQACKCAVSSMRTHHTKRKTPGWFELVRCQKSRLGVMPLEHGSSMAREVLLYLFDSCV